MSTPVLDLDDTHTSPSATTVSLGFILILGRSLKSVGPTSLPSGLDAPALGQFSMELHELAAVRALQSLSEVPN